MTARDPFADEPEAYTNPLGFMSIDQDWQDPKADYDPADDDSAPRPRKPLSPKQERLRDAAKSLRTTYQWGNEDGDDPVLPVTTLAIVRLTLAVEDLTAEVKALREQREP